MATAKAQVRATIEIGLPDVWSGTDKTIDQVKAEVNKAAIERFSQLLPPGARVVDTPSVRLAVFED